MPNLHPVDFLAVVILGAACFRGLSNGLLREVFSVIALGAAVFAVRVWNEPVAGWLYGFLKGEVNSTTLPWLSGALIGIVVVLAVGTFGSVMSRGARAVGLGWADRAGGAAVGLAEGALVVAVLLMIGAGIFGRESGLLSPSRSLTLLEQAEEVASGDRPLPLPDVAAPARDASE